ncbi:hypothetical protein HOE67_01780 [Candidatus Peregrinibacteria bacterium]|jgi:hypothetical protein|nr:hypothetical protein [Candidatus Peregrinibacteria bacterium]MBT4055817.1 hypothetical protein [Candidatus Peregrinibacteria bacterium]
MNLLEKIKEKLPFSIGGKNEDPAKKAEDKAKDVVGGGRPKPNTVPVIESAINTQDAGKPEAILETPPELDQSLLETVEPPKLILLYVLKGALSVFIIIGLGVVGFFTSQLTYRLDFIPLVEIPSLISDLDESNENIKGLQTEYNTYRFLQGKFYLDQFSYEGDEYIRNYYIYSNKSMNEKLRDESYESMQNLKESLGKSFTAARDLFLDDLEVSLIGSEYDDTFRFRELFVALLNKKLNGLAEEISASTSEDDKLEYKLYKRTQRLIGNVSLFELFRGADIDSLDDLGLAKLIVQVNDTVVDELSSIQRIKDDRINWSDIMHRIELETTYVDKYFSKDFYDELGGIQYTSYDFDTSTNKVVITGATKRFDTNNFTMISNLIDQLNESPYFKNVEMRSFTKSGSVEDGYTATLRLNLELQKAALHGGDDEVDIENFPNFLEPPEELVPVTQ